MIFKHHTKVIDHLLKVLLCSAILVCGLSFSDGGSSMAQERNKFEKLNERKNKSNRRTKRRGDKGKSNKAKLRATKFKSRTRQGERAYKGDITGRKVVTKTTKRRSSARYAQPNPYAGRKRRTEESVAKKVLSSPKYTARPSETAKKVRVNPRYSKRPRERSWSSKGFGRAARSISGNTTFTRNRRYQGGAVRSATRSSESKATRGRVVPRSASGNYNVRKRKSPYNVFRQKKAWEKAFKGDITGRTFRTKVTTERPIIQSPRKTKYSQRTGKGDRPYAGGLNGGYKSATRTPERAWKKDISGNKLRIRTSKGPNFSGGQFTPYPVSKNRKGDQAYRGKIKGKHKSISNRKEVAGKKSRASTPPGAGTSKGIRFQGNIKSQKPLKGGGSVARNNWNNRGQSVNKVLNTQQNQKARSFQGNLKLGKPLKGGGSVARNNWNNKGQSVTKASNNEQNRRTRSFQGNLKLGKPLKGGGSIARKNWNNKGQSVNKPVESVEGRKASNFTGNFKPFKGGTYDALAGFYKGDQKRKFKYQKKPNAHKEALKVRPNSKNDRLAINYTGNVKQSNYKHNPNAVKEALKVKSATKNDRLAGNFTGNVKQSGYKHNPNAVKEALKVRSDTKNDRLAGNYTGNFKQSKYKRNPNAADEALKVRSPGKNDFKGGNFTGRSKITWTYKQNPSASKESLKNIAPAKGTAEGASFQGRFKMASNYSRKPHAADGALKGVGPSRAAVKAANYQGNIKMNKKRIGDTHPSFGYAKRNNSSTEEKEKLFGIKLLFSKLFKKNEAQPDNIRNKERAPRFDKREREIWYD